MPTTHLGIALYCKISEEQLQQESKKHQELTAADFFQYLWTHYQWATAHSTDIISLSDRDMDTVTEVNVPGHGRLGYYEDYGWNEQDGFRGVVLLNL